MLLIILARVVASRAFIVSCSFEFLKEKLGCFKVSLTKKPEVSFNLV